MKFISIPAVMAILAGSAAAHSWLECTDTKVLNYDEVKADPTKTVNQECKGFPRNKVHNGDWIAESSYYSYGFDTEYACRDGQRVIGQTATGAPMATVTPGQTLRMRHWGNGHSRWDIGSPNHRLPGLVRIFWAGKPETDIVYTKDLTEQYWIPGAQSNFSSDTVNEVHGTHMNEKANYFTFTVPEKTQNGIQSYVWSWAWKESMVKGVSNDPDVFDNSWDNAWGTCFDLKVVDSKYTGAASPVVAANQPGYDNKKVQEDLSKQVCTKKCFKGGMPSQPCEGENCPPCRYQVDGQTNCFDHDGSGKCPFPNAVECKK